MRNIEALRNYFLGKDPQLEVVLSDNSLRLSGIEGKHYILRGELIKRLTDLKTAMEEADETLQGNIDAEALARSQEDNALDGKITQEATTRAGADGALQNAINTVAGNLSTLTNNVYTKAQVDYLINEIPKFDIEIVQSLPTQDISTTTIYLVPNEDNPLSGNGYEEYIYINNNWELIGTTNIDLSDYYTKEEVDELIESGAVPTIDLKFTDGFTIYNEYIGKVVQIGSYVDHTNTETHEYDGVYAVEEMTGSAKFINLQSKMIYGNLSANTFYWMPGAQGWAPSLDTLIEDDSLVKSLSSPVTIWDLEDGMYLLPASCEVRYGGGTYWPASKALLFVGTENTTTKRYFIFDGTGTQNTITNGSATETSGTIKYFSVGLDYEVAANKTTTAPNAQSTDTQYPTSKAVYSALTNYINKNDVGIAIKTLQGDVVLANTAAGIYYLYSQYSGSVLCKIYKDSAKTELVYSTTLTGGSSRRYFDYAYMIVTQLTTSNAKQCYIFGGLSQEGKLYIGNSVAGEATVEVDLKNLATNDDFTGTDGTTAGTSGLVPAPATTDDGKFLCADGTWQAAGGGSNITYGTQDLTPRSITT